MKERRDRRYTGENVLRKVVQECGAERLPGVSSEAAH